MNKPTKQKVFKNIAIISLIAIFFIGDRLLKFFSSQFFQERLEGLPLISDWLYFGFAKNYQIAFSLPLGGPWLLFLTTAITIIITLIFFKLLWRDKTISYQATLLLLILSGAISNLIDRFHYGYVIDYLLIKGLAALNLADVAISLGSLLLILAIWRGHENKNERNL